jgi:ribosome biogenesis protein NSA1
MTTTNNNNNNNPILACADSLGNISLLNSHNFQKGVVQTYNAFDLSTNQIINSQTISSTANNSGTNNNTAILTYTKGRYSNTSICTAIEICHDGERLAVGGRERGVRLLDLESGKLVWKAKNLPPDPQTLLQQPQWTTAIQAIHHGSSDGVTNLLATGTAYKQVQIYDIRTSSTTRRPVLYTPEGNLFEHRITSLCQLHDNNTLAIGDSIGDCHLIDMRKMHSGKQYSARKQHAKEEIGLGRLVGPGGSIRTLVRHPSLPYLACVGLDRKLWTWDVSKRKMIDCVYLKQRLNCALFCGDDSWNGADNNDNDIDGEENGDNYDGEVDYIQDEEWNNKRERELEKDHQDEVEDYIDSDDDNDGDAQDSGETASDSEDGDDDDSSEGSSSSSHEEDDEEERAHRMKQKRGKRQKV